MKFGTVIDDALAARVRLSADQRGCNISELVERGLRAVLAESLTDWVLPTTPLFVAASGEQARHTEIQCAALIGNRWGVDRLRIIPGGELLFARPGESDRILLGPAIVIGSPKYNCVAASLQTDRVDPWSRFEVCDCRTTQESEQPWHLRTPAGIRHRLWGPGAVEDLAEDWAVIRYLPNPQPGSAGDPWLYLAGIGSLGTFGACQAAVSPPFLENLREALGLSEPVTLPFFECFVRVRASGRGLEPLEVDPSSVRREVPQFPSPEAFPDFGDLVTPVGVEDLSERHREYRAGRRSIPRA